jgi:hypothetical protein
VGRNVRQPQRASSQNSLSDLRGFAGCNFAVKYVLHKPVYVDKLVHEASLGIRMVVGNQVYPFSEASFADVRTHVRISDVGIDQINGRVEYREVWLVESQAMETYLAQDYNWPGVQVSGQIRRSGRPLTSTCWEEQETFTWVSSLPIARASAQLDSGCLCQH